jgi:hypothetical protein
MKQEAQETVLAALENGPQTEIDLRYKLGLRKDQVSELLAQMVSSGAISFTGERRRNSRVFELASKTPAKPASKRRPA